LNLVLLIVVAVALITALVTVILSTKNWHWSQVVLVLFILLFGTTAMFLGARVFLGQRNMRAGIPDLERRLAIAEQETAELLKGTEEELGIHELEHQLKIVTRERGRVWRGVVPAGNVSKQGRVATAIANPKPHGLEKETIIYAFEQGEPTKGPQYLGEFQVVESNAEGVVLEPILLIDQRTGQRLAASGGPWSLYETMPSDRHSLYADFPEEQLQQIMPKYSVEEYVRHGTEAVADDDEWHVIGLDENGERVGPDQIDQAVKKLYDRPLRDYAFLFDDFARERVVAEAARKALIEDNAKLEAALASAEQLTQFREAEKTMLTSDLQGIKQDLAAVQKHRDLVLQQLSTLEQLFEQKLADNSALAQKLTERHQSWIDKIDLAAPAPEGLSSQTP
jgi:hypothetical protein